MTVWKTLEKTNHSQSEILSQLIEESDAIVVGIGAGMSAADGFTYIGPRFEEAFPDFIAKYQLLDMLQASLYDFEDWEEYWAFQSRFVALNYLDQPVGQAYLDLKDILAKKNIILLQLMLIMPSLWLIIIQKKFFIFKVNMAYGSVVNIVINKLIEMIRQFVK